MVQDKSAGSGHVARTLIRTLIVDDSPLFLERAVRWLKKEPHLEVVGQATSGEEALAQVQALKPELVIMDLVMDGLNGIQVAKRMKQEANPPAVILISVHDLVALRKHWAGHVDAVIGKDRFSSDLSLELEAIFPRRGV
jgi:DNA-binding NarL/FixJ family response regulator